MKEKETKGMKEEEANHEKNQIERQERKMVNSIQQAIVEMNGSSYGQPAT